MSEWYSYSTPVKVLYFINVCLIHKIKHIYYMNVFILGFITYLSMEHDVRMPPDGSTYCKILNTTFFTATMCSTLLILNMTFDRFYSIIRPHKAASFNTVKRARLTIICVILFGLIYNIPHAFFTANNGEQCVPFGKAMAFGYGQFYYWLSFVLNFAFPFISLLIMNVFIIQTIRNRFSIPNVVEEGQGQSQGKSSRSKSTTTQIYIILLLVTFSFLVLTTPGYVILLYIMRVDYDKSPKTFAEFYFLDNIGQKTYYTNCGINFFLYVLSGKKFRTDLMNLFHCNKDARKEASLPDSSTKLYSIDSKSTVNTE